MAVTYTYPGTGTGGDVHAFPTRTEHSLSEPFTLADHLNAAAGPGAYSDNMWSQLESLHDVGLQMALLEKFRLTSVYRPFVPVQVAMRTDTGAIAESMSWKGIFAMEPNIDPVGRRQIWFQSNYTDTFSKQIVFNDYADKVALHRYDDLVQAYRFRGSIGLIPIARTLLGESVTVALDVLARNAILESPFFHVIAGGSTTHGPQGVTDPYPDFSGVLATDVFDLSLGRDVWEALAYQDIPMAANPNGVSGALFCVTTPTMIKTVKADADSEWRETHLYANPGLLLRHEVGMWENVRFLTTRRNVLWNCGDITTQGVTQNDYGPGDGADDQLVDGVYSVGQTSGVVNGIELDSAASMEANDVITIHQTRTDDFGVTNGVDYREGTARVRRITRISGNTIYLDKPLFHEFPAGSFVTKGVHIHASCYIGGPSVVNGVGEPIMMYPKEPIDDANAIWRFIWQGRFKYQQFFPEMTHVVFHGGGQPTFGIGTAP
jgi:hypothetical protein